jgi:hypothetical protein
MNSLVKDAVIGTGFGKHAAAPDGATEMRDRARQAGVLRFLNFEFRRNESWAGLRKSKRS